MRVEKAVEATDDLLSVLADLIPQLGQGKVPPTRSELTNILNSPNTSFLIARASDETNEIAGILTLIVYHVPTGARSIVEDVVVSEKFRRRGIAKALLSRAIEIAREAGAGGVSLTSNPNRKEANRLYQSMGFQRRETNAYFLSLG